MVPQYFMEPANKRRKLTSEASEENVADDARHSETILTSGGHPFGVKPWGNFYFDGIKREDAEKTRTDGLGLLAMLEDELVLDLLYFVDSAVSLALLGLASKVTYVFTSEEDLWKERCLDDFGGDWKFADSWRRTYIRRFKPQFAFPFPAHHKHFMLKNFYSDVLFHSWQCCSVDLSEFAGTDNVPRRSNLSFEEFVREYGIPNKPVIITDLVPKWPCFESWTKEGMVQKYGDTEFQIGRVSQKLRDYMAYVSSHPLEDQPLYLFDNDFGEKCPEMLHEYEPPMYFQEDFFKLIKGGDRPSFRWILVGPPRSGSTFHKDPNFTSAWNGLISGAKKWILYPPDVVPPGCFPSEDEFNVTTALSVTEWFVNFYKETKKKNAFKPYECIQRPGELLFIPHAWWHQALNLEESIAVTQNVVDKQNLVNVADFLKKKKKQDLWNKLSEEMQRELPDVWRWLQKELETKAAAAKVSAGPTRSTSLLENGGAPWKLNLFGANAPKPAE